MKVPEEFADYPSRIAGRSDWSRDEYAMVTLDLLKLFYHFSDRRNTSSSQQQFRAQGHNTPRSLETNLPPQARLSCTIELTLKHKHCSALNYSCSHYTVCAEPHGPHWPSDTDIFIMVLFTRHRQQANRAPGRLH